MKKELRRQIKEDEFKSGVEHTLDWVKANQDRARIGAAAIVGAAALVFGVGYFRAHRVNESQRALQAAIEIYEAPVRGEQAEGAEPGPGPVFETSAEKYRKAAAAFDGVERDWGSMPAGIRARYFGALCRIELGDFAAARTALDELAAKREPGDLVPALARLALAELERRSGAVDKAAEAYRQIVDDASFPLPRDAALMTLGTLFEDAHRDKDAGASYKRLVDQFPDSVYAAEARRRLQYLSPSGRG